MKYFFMVILLLGTAHPQNKLAITLETIRYSAAGADFGTTAQFLSEGRCAESDPIFGRHPSALKVIGVGLLFNGAFTFADIITQKRRMSKADKTAATIIINVPLTFAHTFAAQSNRHCL